MLFRSMKVWVNGVFDVIHHGHIRLLEYAKSKGDYVFVGIDSDKRVSELKGNDRPINSQENRMYVLSSIKFINQVVVFGSDDELRKIIASYSPDIMIIGNDYKDKEIIGKEFIKKIVYFNKLDISSTEIINNWQKRF